MQTADDVLKACEFVKTAGTSSRVPVPITVLERLCNDAKRWAETPADIRVMLEETRASK